MPPDGKALALYSTQLLDNSMYQLAVSWLFAKYTNRQLGNIKDYSNSQKVIVHSVTNLTDIIIDFLKSVSDVIGENEMY